MIVYNLVGNINSASHPENQLNTYDVIHPGTGVVPHQVQRSSLADVQNAIETCHVANLSWSTTSFNSRCEIIAKAADLLSRPESGWEAKLRDANMSETSVTHWWAQEQLHVLPEFLRTLARLAPEALSPETVTEGTRTIVIEREPYGVCLAIPAWNATHILTMRAIVTPLIAGNTVLLKTSETTPFTQSLWAELLYAAGLPRDCLSVVHIATEDAPNLISAIVADKRIRHVNFTGSTSVGSIIARIAGQYLKPTLMELGGKAPVLLMPDADLQIAASHILFGAFMNAGQICMSTERVFVPQSQYQTLIIALREAWQQVHNAQPRALFSVPSAQRVRRLTRDALDKGAESILTEREESNQCLENENDAFVEPTILGLVDSTMSIYSEESFGPLAAIVPIPDSDLTEAEIVDEMVRLANDTDYGLTAAVWSKDVKRAMQVARMLQCGAVHINSPTCNDVPTVPHGGWKSSGWGRFNSVEGIRGFTQMRSIEFSTETNPGAMPLSIFEL